MCQENSSILNLSYIVINQHVGSTLTIPFSTIIIHAPLYAIDLMRTRLNIGRYGGGTMPKWKKETMQPVGATRSRWSGNGPNADVQTLRNSSFNIQSRCTRSNAPMCR